MYIYDKCLWHNMPIYYPELLQAIPLHIVAFWQNLVPWYCSFHDCLFVALKKRRHSIHRQCTYTINVYGIICRFIILNCSKQFHCTKLPFAKILSGLSQFSCLFVSRVGWVEKVPLHKVAFWQNIVRWYRGFHTFHQNISNRLNTD